ncbi:MAG: sensor histidine kinase [Acidimicrobiia bacterium]
MSRRSGVDRLAVACAGVTLAVGVALASMLRRGRPSDVWYDLFLFHNGPSAVILAWLGLLVLRRQPGNVAGRILLAIAVLAALHTSVAALADARLVAAGRTAPVRSFADDVRMADLPLDAALSLFTMNWLWVPVPVLMVAVLPVVFPDGSLPGRRWRAVPLAAAVGASLLMAAFAVEAWPTAAWTSDEAPAVVGPLVALGGLAVIGAAVSGLVALGLRWNRADRSRRRPFHVVGATAVILGLVLVATYPWQQVWVPAVLLALYALLSAYALAVARFGLHDIEPFLGRAAVAAILSALVAAVYAAVVIGIGSLIGQPFDDPVLPIVALAAVALLVEPARRRSRRLVDRWLFRADADRREVLSRVAARASTSTTASDVLDEVTELLVRSTGATRAEAWLDADADGPRAAAGGDPIGPAVLAVPVTHQGERFGELRLFARAQADLVADAADLLADVAHAVGVVLRNEQLTVRMQSQLAELQASRQRLVEAHERGRRSLERDIHDGAQSRLIALRLRIGATHARFAHRDPDLASELDELAREVDGSVRALRDLARGLAPPLLEQSGLVAALRAHTRALPVPVQVTVRGDARYVPAIESAAYFCCLEAIQNAVQHGGATAVAVVLDSDPTRLRFEVCDDGIGFDTARAGRGTGLTNIADRVDALGGTAEVESTPGRGTRVTGTIPARPGHGAPVAAER